MLIYLAENTITGKCYVGATKHASVKKRMTEHKSKANLGKRTRFHEAIREYGWEAFRWSVLSKCASLEDVLAEERRLVAELKTTSPEHGYNMTKGGCGVIGYEFSEEARAKISRAGMGRGKSEETRRKLSIANKGKRPSDACIAASLIRGLTTEQRRANGRSNKGRKHIWSEERIVSHRAAQKRKQESDKYGKIPHSHLPEIRARRAAGESFAAIAATYKTDASNLFVWLKRRVPS